MEFNTFSIMAGWGGAFPLIGGDGKGTLPAGGRLLTFALNGKLRVAGASCAEVELHAY